jgi:hypothetical protein
MSKQEWIDAITTDINAAADAEERAILIEQYLDLIWRDKQLDEDDGPEDPHILEGHRMSVHGDVL